MKQTDSILVTWEKSEDGNLYQIQLSTVRDGITYYVNATYDATDIEGKDRDFSRRAVITMRDRLLEVVRRGEEEKQVNLTP